MVPPAERRSSRGQVGVEALIVFIAMILVAMISASLLLQTAGVLQTSTEETADESGDQIVDRLNVISAYADERQQRRDVVDLQNSYSQLTNGSISVYNNSAAINYKAGVDLTGEVDSGGNVTVSGTNANLTVQDGDRIMFVNRSSGGWSFIAGSDSDSIYFEGSDLNVTDDGDGTSGEVLSIVEPGGGTISLAEGSSDSARAESLRPKILVDHRDTVSVGVSSGDSVPVSGWGGTAIELHDGDAVEVRVEGDGEITLLNRNTSESLTTSYPLVVENDTDGTPDEMLTFTNATGAQVELPEDTDGVFRTDSDADYELDTKTFTDRLVVDSGDAVAASVSSGGDATLTDGDAELVVYDGDDLIAKRSDADELVLKNANTSASLTTTSAAVYATDDADGTAGESLTLTNADGDAVESAERERPLIEVSFGTRALDTSYDTVEISVMKGPGAGDVDLGDATIEVVSPDGAHTLTYSGNETPVENDQFGVVAVQDEGATAPALTSRRDRFKLLLDLETAVAPDQYVIKVVSPAGSVSHARIDDNLR